MNVKPILFNTAMVRAILEGRKTQTRRIAKALCFTEKRCDGLIPSEFRFFISPKTGLVYWKDIEKIVMRDGKSVKAPYIPGDIMWVRETFLRCFMTRFQYKADDSDGAIDQAFIQHGWKWKPSIHMPREAARIFLRVTDVWVERLQDIDEKGILSEGIYNQDEEHVLLKGRIGLYYRKLFSALWDRTVTKKELFQYGWHANPWVWVIEFERCEKPEGWC